jgi:hypothetical protein
VGLGLALLLLDDVADEHVAARLQLEGLAAGLADLELLDLSERLDPRAFLVDPALGRGRERIRLQVGLMTTSSWGSLGPVFSASNVTWPAGADALAGVTENSFRVTPTVVCAVVVGAWVAGGPRWVPRPRRPPGPGRRRAP